LSAGSLSLEDKYKRQQGRIFLTGIEAVVRLLLDKQRLDGATGKVNQTFITGYEGSPLGGLDLKIVQNLSLLNQQGRTVHQFGINEKTAASAVLGTQYAANVDVDAFWYGKAHGTMWIPDELWLANLAGTAGRGAMVLLSGEDHRSKSSVSPGASDWALRSSMVPTFYPSSVEEVLRLGWHALNLSRLTGVVTALKLVTPVCDAASTVEIGPDFFSCTLPAGAYTKRFNPIVMAGGAVPMQRELVERKLPLVEEYVRLNQLNRIVDGDAGGDIGIVATGKSYTDVRQALDFMGVRLPVLHLGVSYPLEKQIVTRFAAGLKRVYLVEEPGPFVEDALKAALWGSGVEGVYGQWDEEGKPFIPAYGEVDPEVLARLLWPRIKGQGGRSEAMAQLDAHLSRPYPTVPAVTPMSCGGCPYNTFRDLTEKPGGAIGCSSIRATDAYDNGVLYIPTMGAGGSIYSGTAAFNGNRHIYQYLGDGSYFHSGRGAIQSCVQSEVNITYLLLFNGAVALTGGQVPGGQRSVEEVARELLALGVKKVGIVSEEPQRYSTLTTAEIEVYGLEAHAEALAYFKAIKGTTVLILDKECATERGRRQKRAGESPEKYVLIDESVCEGCGDCYAKSEGCAALYSVETSYGDKTQIRQANCSQDGLCVDGECPSFYEVVDVSGEGLRRRQPPIPGKLPDPQLCSNDGAWTILAVGRGGTGVVTVSHLVAYAAMLEDKPVYLSNNTGLAQKGGPVEAPIVIGGQVQPVFNRLFPAQVDLYLGFDLLCAAEPANLRYAGLGRSVALVSTSRVPTASINRQGGRGYPDEALLKGAIDGCSRKDENIYIDTYWLAERLFSDIIYANMLLLGAAYQAGQIPLRAESIEAAIQLNGKGTENNLLAFRWGRLAVADPGQVEAQLGRQKPGPEQVLQTARALLVDEEQRGFYDEVLAELAGADKLQAEVGQRLADLCAWGGVGSARRYWQCLQAVKGQDSAERGWALSLVVARHLFKLMAYKDEYEVARLLTRTEAENHLADTFAGQVKRRYRLHPPTMRRWWRGKMSLGEWALPFLRLLARGKFLRGSAFDPFGRTACRRLERHLVGWYEEVIDRCLSRLADDSYTSVLEVLDLADGIRGYEQVKIDKAKAVCEAVDLHLKKLET
jgi:indolepyruvate ferredoxin oxidoreductase